MSAATTLDTLIAAIKGQRLQRQLLSEKPTVFGLIFVDAHEHPLPDQPLHFEFLGNGANKSVFAVTVGGTHKTPTDWVLCVQNSMLTPATKEFAGETGILAYVGSKGVRVPRPFETPLPKDFIVDVLLSNDEDSHHVAGCAFFMQRLDIGGRFIEMRKLDKPEDFMKKCLGEKDAIKHVATTIDAVKHIRTVFDANPWADFQVLYDKADGGLMVFDPWPDKAGIKQKAVDDMLDKWLHDLGAAVKH
ncbi:hypothetical protein A1O7_10026 [Cladophialophora yegresii CBS 114405]|uniref:Uncharacterized protein n=1 Tax=Cladophialophora yegresii CBS 114405 TaxID=1182544 RepID=W9VNU3_9EURO|nr:uncharacterized protein A1O7_10026 [Cladophialophora yegresii CBS 114405]EXJ54685.1 hypothetical protein A1O7_10026 [Cladophialophora yegresii CBS 114405]